MSIWTKLAALEAVQRRAARLSVELAAALEPSDIAPLTRGAALAHADALGESLRTLRARLEKHQAVRGFCTASKL